MSLLLKITKADAATRRMKLVSEEIKKNKNERDIQRYTRMVTNEIIDYITLESEKPGFAIDKLVVACRTVDGVLCPHRAMDGAYMVNLVAGEGICFGDVLGITKRALDVAMEGINSAPDCPSKLEAYFHGNSSVCTGSLQCRALFFVYHFRLVDGIPKKLSF